LLQIPYIFRTKSTGFTLKISLNLLAKIKSALKHSLHGFSKRFFLRMAGLTNGIFLFKLKGEKSTDFTKTPWIFVAV